MLTATKPQTKLTLEDFLNLPETEPASEFINGEITKKPMPQGKHSRLQSKLCQAINQIAETQEIAYAFPELRCTFGGESIIPDVVVYRWKRIPLDISGRIANHFEIHPDWSIEILSPNQSLTKVLAKLLHCSHHGTELGWLINPEEEKILVVFPEQKIEIYQGEKPLPILTEIELELTAETVFSWLKFTK
jgi:Uma2 family endonuclease